MTPEEIAKLPYRPCVGVVLLNANGLVFAGQRIDNASSAWQMPQGGIDPGEEPVEAALRELTEETGIPASLVTVVAESNEWLPYELPVDLIPKLWKGRFRGQKQRWFVMRFNGTDNDVNIKTEHQEFSEWRWLAASTILDEIVPFKRDVYSAVFAEFSDILS